MYRVADWKKLQSFDFEVDGQGVLSVREAESLGYLARGDNANEIARAMHITPRTAVAHRESIKDKLQAKNPAQAVATAFAMNMLKVVPKAFPKLILAVVLSGALTESGLQRGVRMPRRGREVASRYRRRDETHWETCLVQYHKQVGGQA